MDRNEEIKAYRKRYSELIAACWQDEDVKKKFLENPKDVLKEYSVPVEESKKYQVVEADKYSTYAVLPYENVEEAVQSMFKMFHAWSEKGKQIIKPSCELRLIQNTADTNYVVLPVCPELYTEEEKAMLREAEGVTEVQVDVEVQFEVALQVVAAQTAAVLTTVAASAEVALETVALVVAFVVLI